MSTEDITQAAGPEIDGDNPELQDGADQPKNDDQSPKGEGDSQDKPKNPAFKPSKKHAKRRVSEKMKEKDKTIEELNERIQKLEELQVETSKVNTLTLLKANGVEDDEAIDLITSYMETTGKSAEDVLKNPIVKKELKAINGRKKAEREGTQKSDGSKTLDYYLRTGEVPEDPKVRKQLREEVAKSTTPKTF